jgi:hypothetical protein
MKIKKELGSAAVRDLVERASARAQQLPDRSVRDPWPSSSRVISESVEAESAVTRPTKE